jgi:outer membrane receptor for ferrienterochelin and colicin
MVLGITTLAGAQTQITTGVIQGTVTDATGAALPGVTVEVRNVDTNLTRTLVTENDGRFVFLQLPPGAYRVSFTLSGFAPMVQENVQVTVGQSVTLPVSLKVGGLAETVTVSSSAGVVESTRSAAASTIDRAVVENIPNLGRKFEDLLTLTPGVSVVQGPDGDEITFAGQRGIFNNISLDGGDYNNGFFGEQAGGQRVAIDITLEAVKEFQVIATGAPAEFGRTAGGVVNVITKSGTNSPHGSLFYFQRLEELTGELSDESKLEGFHREQWGGTFGGPIKQDKAFFFAALEGITGNFERPNLSRQLGSTACPVSNPTVPANEALINSNPDCQRTALLSFFSSRLGQDEGLPIKHPVETVAILTKADFALNPNNNLSVSWNFNHSKKENETFDVETYGTSANGIEGNPARINVINANWFTTLSSRMLNEAHFTYSREARPRTAVDSNLPADTGMGFVPTFRFGNPFFLQPAVDELIWRTQFKNNVSLVWGTHTFKAGGEWMHTLNDQVFRGFFTGRYIFDSVTGFLRYASPAAAGGFGPNTVGCSNGTFVTAPATCPGGATTGGPLLLYLQGAGLSGPATDAAGASKITNDEFSLFIQDQWQPTRTLTVNYGLRWDAQVMPKTVDPSTTAYGAFLDNPTFPSDGTIPSQWAMFQPRGGVAWDVRGDGKSVVRGSAGVYSARQNMLSQVGSVTTNGIQQQTLFAASFLAGIAPMPVWPGVLVPPAVPAGQFPPGTGVRVFHRDYKNPRVYAFNVGYEQELMPDWAGYVDFIWTEGRNLTRFLNWNRSGPAVCCDQGPGTGNTFVYNGPPPFGPQLGEVMVTNSLGESRYRGLTLGVRKRFSDNYQLEGNYVLSKDEDDDSNERDPFTDRSFNFFDLSQDWGPSDRDIRHKVNIFGYVTVSGFQINARAQGRTSQPITPSPRSLDGVDRGRNSERKDNAYFSFDWRLAYPIRLNGDIQIIPIVEMFNTFNNENNINPLSTPALFDFNGFLRVGVGDPRQMQLAVKVLF